MRKKYTRQCPYCSNTFHPHHADQIGCSHSCSVRARPRPTVLERFWAKVDKSGICWLWLGRPGRGGYGKFSITSRHATQAHRFSYELAHGPIPDGLLVCHNCPGGDNPACVNPAHLWLGTDTENIADRDRKGRQAKGERHGSRLHPGAIARGDRNGSRIHRDRMQRGEQCHSARLTVEQVKAIRTVYAGGGVKQATLAAQFGVNQATISKIVRRVKWEHVA